LRPVLSALDGTTFNAETAELAKQKPFSAGSASSALIVVVAIWEQHEAFGDTRGTAC
jgi:hypothetical protein